ncbi:MAG: hypothetical protein ACPG4Y_01415, partial [Chitinophagales bacterium]
VEGIHSKKNLQQVVKFKVKGSLSEKIFEGYNLKALNNNFYKITSNEKTDLREIVFNKCVKHNVLLLHLEKEEENLENVFMDLTSNKS